MIALNPAPLTRRGSLTGRRTLEGVGAEDAMLNDGLNARQGGQPPSKARVAFSFLAAPEVPTPVRPSVRCFTSISLAERHP